MRTFAKPLPPHIRAVFVALAVMAFAPKAQAQDNFPRAARTIARGDTIGPADILFDTTNSAAASQIAGLVARRIIRAGEPLKAPAIGKPALIVVGQTVSVQSFVGGATISRQGIAQAAASLGDTIHVRLDPRNTIVGVVSGKATVTITK